MAENINIVLYINNNMWFKFDLLCFIGVEIGRLPTEQHEVSGTLHVTDSRTLFFADFNYDGGGPGIPWTSDYLAYLHSSRNNKTYGGLVHLLTKLIRCIKNWTNSSQNISMWGYSSSDKRIKAFHKNFSLIWLSSGLASSQATPTPKNKGPVTRNTTLFVRHLQQNVSVLHIIQICIIPEGYQLNGWISLDKGFAECITQLTSTTYLYVLACLVDMRREN